jgi:hypothetical protein
MTQFRKDAARTRRAMVAAGAVLTVAMAAAVVASAADATQQAANGYKLVGGWGKTGTATGQFSNATGLAVDKAGNVYVADRDNNRVQVFNAKGAFLRKWGSIGSGDGQFTGADDVAVAPDGTVWVADDGGGRYQQFSAGGVFQTAVTLQSELARGVAVDANGDLLGSVEGSSKSGFRRFTAGSWNPSGGLFGAQPVMRADDIEASPDGTLYLIRAGTQGGGDWLERYSAGGKLLKKSKLTPGDATRALAVDLDCNVLVSHWSGGTGFDKLSPSGKLLATGPAEAPVRDLAVGPKGDVYALLNGAGVARYAENRGATIGTVGGVVSVAGGTAKVKYTLTGVACPAEVTAVASLKGAVNGKATVKVPAGKPTVLSIPAKGSSGKATFTIVLKTNGRPTTQSAAVNVAMK